MYRRIYICRNKISKGKGEKASVYIGEHRNMENKLNYKTQSKKIDFSETAHLRSHKHTQTSEKSYCDICGKLFTRKNIAVHKRSHTGEKPYRCDICGKTFSQSCAVIKHKRTHTGDKPYRCEICGKSFSESHNLSRHRRIHTGEKPFCCQICGTSFTLNHHLTRHKHTHTGDTSSIFSIYKD
ncbi:zinc finger 239-like isoform X2 [Octopus vulgaris]|uniref:Zinc finger 239-like isoform X2 n=1 Tax=Octopus vulgaris TaxID=6645 RepID=A0AA36BSL3_OCTVU|nr:zinc finger 239-like isoform X2 [Octopus vulgaris]